MGDAEGGTECKVAIDSTSHECIIACLTKKKRNPNINRVTMRSNLKGNWKTCKLIGNVCKVLLNLALYPTLLEYSMLRNREHAFLFQEFFERFSNGMNQICLYYSTCSKVFFNFNNTTDNTTTTATTTTTTTTTAINNNNNDNNNNSNNNNSNNNSYVISIYTTTTIIIS